MVQAATVQAPLARWLLKPASKREKKIGEEEKQTLPLSTHCQLLWLPKDLQAGPLYCVDSADLKCKCMCALDAVHIFPFNNRQVVHIGMIAETINKQNGCLLFFLFFFI